MGYYLGYKVGLVYIMVFVRQIMVFATTSAQVPRFKNQHVLLYKIIYIYIHNIYNVSMYILYIYNALYGAQPRRPKDLHLTDLGL